MIVLSREEYRLIGLRHGAQKYHKEATECLERWKREFEIARKWSKGLEAQNRLTALIMQHAQMMTDRPAAVIAKIRIAKNFSAYHARYNYFVDRSVTILDETSYKNAQIDEELYTNIAKNETPASLTKNLLKMLRAYLNDIPTDCDVGELLTEGDALLPLLTAIAPEKSLAGDSPVEDTEELDVLEGKMNIEIKSFNTALRKAFRHLGNKSKMREFKFYYITSSSNPSPKDATNEDDLDDEDDDEVTAETPTEETHQ